MLIRSTKAAQFSVTRSAFLVGSSSHPPPIFIQHLRLLSTSNAPPTPSSTPTKLTRPDEVIQTLPFVMTPERAKRVVESGVHTVLGLPYILRLLANRVFRWFGIDLGLTNNMVEMVAFKPLLLPVWKLDIRLKGRAVLDGVGLLFRVTAPNATAPAFSLNPLHQLGLNGKWDSEPEAFVPSKHSKQQGLDVDYLPFTRTPTLLIDELLKAPRTNAQTSGIDIDPGQLKPVLFACYPLYLPIYISEWRELVGEERRVTCVAHGATNRTEFSVFLPFLNPPQWMPSNQSVEVYVGGAPEILDQQIPPGTQEKFRPLLEAFVQGGGRTLKISTPINGIEDVLQNPHVMAYSPNSAENNAFMDAEEKLSEVQAEAKMFEAKTANTQAAKAIVVSRGGIKVAAPQALRELMQKNVEHAKGKAEASKPSWLKELESRR